MGLGGPLVVNTRPMGHEDHGARPNPEAGIAPGRLLAEPD